MPNFDVWFSCVIQVVLLLYIANWLVHLLWRRGSDPDNSAIPYLTAAGDLLGTVLLALAFFVLTLLSTHHKTKVTYCSVLQIVTSYFSSSRLSSHQPEICFNSNDNNSGLIF